MVIDIHYNGIDATVGITTEVTGQFAPAFETRFPTDASPNGYGYQQFYVNNDNQNLYTQVMKSTCVPLEFREKEEFVKWPNTFFKGKIKIPGPFIWQAARGYAAPSARPFCRGRA